MQRNLVILAIAMFAAPLSVAAQTCGETTWDLWAGQTNDVGSVTVSNDQDNVYVTYQLDDLTASFGNLHLWVGTDLANMPASPGNGAPVPGQFCHVAGGACADATGLISYTFAIPFSEIGILDADTGCDESLYVVPHAEVTYDSDGDGTPDGGDTAFGGDRPGDGPRWWFYGVYTICCDPDTPDFNLCETAFAKGGWVWTTHKKSNPEGLPSLNLTRNRWGWAINLTEPGLAEYDVWAGAGLNKTGNGTLVGTLTVDWDGSAVTVSYTIDVDYLTEVHIYAGDTPPSTTAPGQFGFTAEPGGNFFSTTLPLIDADGDGVWLIAHAVVCDQVP